MKVVQWQPDCIRKCKIRGIAVHVLGANGKQFACYTNNRFGWTPPTAPAGGGFGVEKFSLQYLYEEHQRGNNYWTTSNTYLDLVRYTGTKIRFFRHPHMDFIASYTRMLPMALEKHTFPDAHPHQQLKAKHKVLIPSLLTKPHGKRTVTIHIKPPKQLTNKWMFQHTFAKQSLFQLSTAACDLRYPHIGCCNSNDLTSFYCLNLDFYQRQAWGNRTNPYAITDHQWYKPTPNIAQVKTVQIGTKQVKVNQHNPSDYTETISYTKGWFQPNLLQAEKIVDPAQLNIPIAASRYNPNRDDGVGNEVYLVSVLNSSIEPPKTDFDLYISGLPLWQLLYGFTDFVNAIKKESTFTKTYYIAFKCKYCEPQGNLRHIFIPVDPDFIKGNGPYGSIPTAYQQNNWYPTLEHQVKTINNIVATGPFIPKLDNISKSTWELYSQYTSYFKFGGATLPEPDTASPQEQGDYPVPNNITKTIQITNPQKTSPLNTLHNWDYRRGIITSSALKRMLENQETDTDFQTDAEPSKKKKKVQGNELKYMEEETQEIQNCLLSLCEESTCQDPTQEQDLLKLIQHQQQQQQHLKRQLLLLISDLKAKQKALQLQTGLLE